MTTPTTPSGKRLLARLKSRMENLGGIEVAGADYVEARSALPAIEQEARAMERERLRAKAEGIAAPGFPVSPEWRRVLDWLLADPEPDR